MKRTKKAFTIVEVIIVIAVIGILAAILILALPRAIDEANERSALSDAKNMLTETHIESDPADAVSTDLIVVVEKSGKEYVFAVEEGLDPVPCYGNPFDTTDRFALVNALCEIRLIDAPVGLTEIQLSEQFPNVSLFTGGKFSKERRIDVEVGKEYTELPESSLLKTSWKSSDPAIADVNGSEIVGKSVGIAVLTASCGNLRLEFDVHVGAHVEVETFSELKAACEDDSDSVYIYCKSTVPNGFLEAELSELPVVIPAGKYVDLCGDMGGVLKEDSTIEARMVAGYSFKSLDERAEAMFINDGGIFCITHAGVWMSAEDLSLPNTGACVVNRNGGSFYARDEAMLNNRNTYVLPGSYIFNIDDTYTDEEKAWINAYENSDGLAVLNEDGFADIREYSFVEDIKNCKYGRMSYDGNGVSMIFTLINEGVIYKLDGAYVSASRAVCSDGQPVKNSGTIYSIDNSKIHVVYGAKGIVSSGTIYSITDCKFTSTASEKTQEEMKESYHFTDEQIDEIMKRPLTPICITGGQIGEITDCEFECDEIIFDGVPLQRCIKSGKFREKPDYRMIVSGSVCVYDEETKLYIVGENVQEEGTRRITFADVERIFAQLNEMKENGQILYFANVGAMFDEIAGEPDRKELASGTQLWSMDYFLNDEGTQYVHIEQMSQGGEVTVRYYDMEDGYVMQINGSVTEF